MASVKLENLVKRFGKTEVLHGIDLKIEDGEFIVFVGPSGCGKSTTLRMIAGLEEISQGSVLIKGNVVNDIPPKDRNIAMVFQNYALYPHMNIFKNMSFGLKLKKMPKDEITKIVHHTARILNIEELLDRKPSELSGGQRQRVAMGRAIVRNPDIFLFDEPLSNLDAKLRTQMRLEIKQLHQRIKNTIIYVTHDQVEAMTLGDRIVVIKDGYIEQVGTPIDLFENPKNKFVAGFIGNPPMNFIDGRIIRDDSGLKIYINREMAIPIPAKTGSELHEGMNVTMGLRPDDVSLADPSSATPESWMFKGAVYVTEPLGNETHMHLTVSGINLTGLCKDRTPISPNQEAKIAFNLNHLHIFDAKTTASLY